MLKLRKTIMRLGQAFALGIVLGASVQAAGAAAATGPLPIVGVGAKADGVVGVGPGVAVVVCHAAVGAHVLGIPVAVQAHGLEAYLAANPGDYVGVCQTPRDGALATGTQGAGGVPASLAMEAGLLASVGDGALVIACASGDGQLFLAPEAAAALVATDPNVKFGQCGTQASGRTGGGTPAPSSATPSSRTGALFVAGGVSVSASSLRCGDRLLVTRVATTPSVIRAKRTQLTARFVIVDERGFLVRGATVWMRSTPLGYIGASPRKQTGPDGSVRFQLTTTKKLPLRAGGRLVLFARATLPGQPLIGCVTGRRLVSLRVSTPQR